MFDFPREGIFPSWFANRIQDFLSAAHTDLRVTLKDADTIQVVPDPELGIAAIALQGRWRFNTATVQRDHPGGAKGTYIVWAVGEDNDIDDTPKPHTDHTDYAFDLRITSGANPSGSGVTIFEKIAELDWSGTEIEALRQTHGSVTGPMLADNALPDTASSDVEWKREPGGGYLLQLKANVVGANELADNSVDTAALQNLAIVTAKVAALAITEALVAVDAISTAKIVALAVTSAKVAVEAITEEKLAAESVSTAKIKLLAVTSAILAAESVTTAKVGALAITEAKIAAEAVSTAKLANLAVTAAKIAAEAVETAKIKNLAVSTAKIAEQAVTEAKLAPSIVERLHFPGDLIPTATFKPRTGCLAIIGQDVSRAEFAVLFGAIAIITTGNTTLGSKSVEGIPSTEFMEVGMPVSGPGIQAGTTIEAVNSGVKITLSLAATATAGAVAIVVAPYGVGNGTTTFTLPDGRGTGFIGADKGAGRLTANARLGARAGAEKHTLALTEIPSHGHAVSASILAFQNEGAANGVQAHRGGNGFPWDELPVSAGSTAVGGGGAHNNMPPYQTSNWMIKT